MHRFWECSKLKQLFKYIKENIQNIDNKINCKTFILGSETREYKYGLSFLEMKRYIYLAKRNSILPSCVGFKGSLRLAWLINKNIHMSKIEKENWSIVRSPIE